VRVLYVGHTYVVQLNRRKLEHLARLDDVDLHVIVPKDWPHTLGRYRAAPDPDVPYSLWPMRTLFAGFPSRYVYLDVTMRIPHIRPDIIHVEQGAHAASYAQAILVKQLFCSRAKCVFLTWQDLPYTLRWKPHWWVLERFCLRHTDLAFTGNAAARDVLRARGFGGPVKVLPHLGVDVDLFRAYPSERRAAIRRTLGLDGFVVGYVGRFLRAKGILTLLDAVGRLSLRVTLLLIGRGELRAEIEAHSSRLGIADRVRIVDAVPHANVPRYMNAMDVLVLGSLTTPPYAPTFKEQFGHVLIEAMACEVPVIGSDSGEIPNVIGDAGLVFHEGNADQLARQIKALVSDPKLRAELATKGRQRVLARYTNERIAEETYAAYRELLSGG